MRPGKMRDAVLAREMAEEARHAAREHGMRRSEADVLERDVADVAGERTFVL